ncbi:c-type cytochrome [Leptospira sp. GIMC2001]|uniref:c-type cytochrome n=1 Tax=Leptospira sp. GIMC2001 TaxID=1513297 RepID=UPI0023496560|nr:cytochrome c [Leptospira sp. GIMC2001]WCL48455.1 cytochrome c [Leptospira sp. GIMC2001]
MTETKLFSTKLVFIAVAILTVANCKYKTPPLEYFNQMYDSHAREAQEEDTFFSNKSASRIPPYGAIPVGYTPYPYISVLNPDDLPAPSKGLVSPVSNPSLDDYRKGEQKYQTYCTPCHGNQGLGNGNVVGPYPRFATAPPSVVSDKIKGWSDGQLYHIVTMGRGVMGSYAYQIEPEDRWKLVAYIRKLQEYDSRKKN